MIGSRSKIRYELSSKVTRIRRGAWHLYFHAESMAWAKTDSIGSFILEALQIPKTEEEIAGEISAETGHSYDEISDEVARFLSSVLEKGLLEVEGTLRPQKERVAAGDLPRSRSLYLHLTESCNLTCSYCYVLAQRSRSGLKADLSFALALSALRQAEEMEIGAVFVTGGEPLLHPRALDIVKSAHTRGFYVALLTNGLLIDGQAAERLAAYCDQITISLDSAVPKFHDIHRGPGTHERAVEAIMRLKDAGAKQVIAAGVITRCNQHEPYVDFITYCKKIGADGASRSLYILQGDARDEGLKVEFASFQRQREKKLEEAIAVSALPWEGGEISWRDRCGAACGVIAIGVDGNVYPCQGLMRKEFAAGNIADNPLVEIYAHSKILRRIRNITVEEIPGCRDCGFKFICGGGCRALAYNADRFLLAPIPKEYCTFAQLVSERKLWAQAGGDCSEGVRSTRV